MQWSPLYGGFIECIFLSDNLFKFVSLWFLFFILLLLSLLLFSKESSVCFSSRLVQPLNSVKHEWNSEIWLKLLNSVKHKTKLEDLINKYTKIQLHINYIKTCKKDDLILTSSQVYVEIKHATQKLKAKIALAVMETEMQNKYDQKRRTKKQIWDIKLHLKPSLTLILYNTLLHQMNVADKSIFQTIATRHLNKLINFPNKRYTWSSNSNHISFIKSTPYDMSSYTLTEDEYNPLTFRLDHHVPQEPTKILLRLKLSSIFKVLITIKMIF